MNLADWIDRHALFTPDKPALRDAAGELDYRALAATVARLAGVLRGPLGVGPGDRVASIGYNCSETLALLFACARVGAIFLPLNWRLAPPEHHYILGDCTPRALFVRPEFVAGVDAARAPLAGLALVGRGELPDGWRDLDALEQAATPLTGAGSSAGYADPLLLCYTSGTTGRPKGALLDQLALLFSALNSAHMHDLTAADRVLTTLPLFHVGGLNIQTVPALHAGATVTLHAAFDPGATLETLAAERTTLTVLVPAQLQALLAHPRWADADLSSLRVISTGSTLVARALIDAVHARGVPLIQVYGATETAPIAAYLRREDAARKAGSGGLPALHCALRVVDEQGDEVPAGEPGEVLVQGPNVMRGYWNNPQASADALRDGWFHSGDIGHLDADGYLYIDDRKKDLIISGGENVYPAEIEGLLAGCPLLAEVAVVGRADARWGEVPVAVAVPRDGAELDLAALQAFCAGRLARYKHPRDVLVVDALPRNAMGKIQKDAVRRLVAERAAGQAG
ncbi:MAG TPA: long-chain fatty acid--CoA ligase [Gammaproteobacteria bacterium]